eukprot:8871171-Ditylum_brightwellii.AAC.1
MNLVLVNNDITSPVPEELCNTDHNGWITGVVGQVYNGGASNACNAILSPLGLYNKDGWLSVTRGCNICTRCTTFGCTLCIEKTPTNGNKVYRILNELFTETSGRTWINNDNLLVVGKDICEYYIVACKNDNLDGGVSKYNLASAVLEDKVPTFIHELPCLEVLKLTNNDIKLSFKGIEKATHLKILHLS